MKHFIVSTILVWLLPMLALASPQAGDEGSATSALDRYSPYANPTIPSRVYWGDTHVHTSLSLDARGFGLTLGPDEAFRFARGETVTTSHGVKARLRRPLDWLVIADHSDGMGAMNEIFDGNPKYTQNPLIQGWHDRLTQGGEIAKKAVVEVFNRFSGGDLPPEFDDPAFTKNVWADYLRVAEKYNEPGNFTTLIGYEWTSTPGGNNLHRNVIYRDGADRAARMLPFTTAESVNPEDLWRWMAHYEELTGGNLIAIPHNGNMSNGTMFPVEKNPASGKPLTTGYAQARKRWEPLYEVTQIKGDAEAHPLLSPNDEFADFETWDESNMGPVLKKPEMIQYEYAREALKNGLSLENRFGSNPYKFGMIGSTDTHTGMSAAEEENFFGKHSLLEPEPERWKHLMAKLGEVEMISWKTSASGYTGVWATENTREAIFDALARKEVYATSGSRILVRFFGGWQYHKGDENLSAFAESAYNRGVPMGADLPKKTKGDAAPSFIVSAMKDPYGANLDRVQIIKGWLDASGATRERIYNVAWAGERRLDSEGKLPSLGSTVNVDEATWTDDIGAPALATVWSDPDFDPAEKAFYYARVIEIPTPRWTAYDRKRFAVEMAKEVPMTLQERAYTSPIWYTPEN